MNEVRKHVDQILAEMKGIDIGDRESYEAASDFIKKVKQTVKLVEAEYEYTKKVAYDAYKEVLAEIKSFTDPLAEAESTIKKKMKEYLAAQERARIEAEAKARKLIEEERLAKAIETGDESKLDKQIDLGKGFMAPPKVDGVHTVEVWKYEIVDPSQVNHEFMIPDEQAIRRTVTTMKDKAAALLGAGVRVWSERDVRVRA